MARLPTKDRTTVVHILKKRAHKFQGSQKMKKAVTMASKEASDDTTSSTSMYTDWKIWVLLHGSEKVVSEDIRNIRESIGMQFNGSHNSFGILAKKGRGNKKELVEGEGGSRGSGKVVK